MVRQEILIIGKDRGHSGQIGRILEDAGYGVAQEAHFDDAFDQLQPSWPNLLVLALTPASRQGITLIRTIRSDELVSELPIVVISNCKTTMDAVVALECGADDYMESPYGPRELAARIGAVLRRRQTTSQYKEKELPTLDDAPPYRATP